MMIKKTFTTMAMPCTITIADYKLNQEIKNAIKVVKLRLKEIDKTYSPFIKSSVISQLNRQEIRQSALPKEVKKILKYAEETKKLSNGYFDIKRPDGQIDPCGLVKGWAILEASKILKNLEYKNFMIEIAGDIQTAGFVSKNIKWTIGIRNPFNFNEIIKVVQLSGQAIATSGTYMQGSHIYNPKNNKLIDEIVSLTAIGPNIYEADRFATAAFAMGKKGIEFIQNYHGLECYMINKDAVATFTSGFMKFVKKDV